MKQDTSKNYGNYVTVFNCNNKVKQERRDMCDRAIRNDYPLNCIRVFLKTN